MSLPPPRPVYFGPAERACFGWLHAPAAGVTPVAGLVICPPFGFEEVCAHRSLRELASAAATAGIATVRVDLPGCGHSSGDEFLPDLWPTWQLALHEAAAALREDFGVACVVLLGLRLGATLAVLAASGRDDVAGVVAIAPVMRGRAYLRELALLEAAASPGAVEMDGLTQSTGFVMSATTVAAMRAVDLHVLSGPPAPHVLVVERDDLPPASDVVDAFMRTGAAVEVGRWSGYLRMMDDPQRCEVPWAMVNGIIATLLRWCTDDALTAQRISAGSPWHDALRMRERDDIVVERPLQVSTNGATMVGVVAEPEPARAGRPALLLLTAGAVHAIGPNRLWVRLARRWAARGWTVLRLDLTGVGDSPAPPGADEGVVYSRQALDDVRAAVTFLRSRHGAASVHLVGLCSGAYHALKAAVRGLPIDACIAINPLTFFWHEVDALKDVKDFEVHKLTDIYRRKILSGDSWSKLLRGHIDLEVVAMVLVRRVAAALEPWWLDLRRAVGRPPAEDVTLELAAAHGRGVRLHFVFAQPHPGLALFEQRGGLAAKRLLAAGAFTLQLVPNADHTFTRRDQQDQLVAIIDEHLEHACKRA